MVLTHDFTTLILITMHITYHRIRHWCRTYANELQVAGMVISAAASGVYLAIQVCGG